MDSKKYYYRADLADYFVYEHSIFDHVFDRSRKILNYPDNFVNFSRPGIVGSCKKIDEIFYHRVQDILNKSDGKFLNIFYSGGIDSTSLLVAFLLHSPNEQIVLHLNRESIKEYESFYQDVILKNKKIKIIFKEKNNFNDVYNFNFKKKYLEDLIDNGEVVVNGEIGDQIFGSRNLTTRDPEYLKQEPFYMLRNSWDHSKRVEELVIKSYKSAPYKLKNKADLAWWMSYNYIYVLSQIRWLLYSNKFILEKNLFNFFDLDDWNDYAVNTPIEVKIPGLKKENAKRPLKDYIYNYHKDDQYLNYKTKEGSLTGNSLMLHSDYKAVTSDWEFLS